MAHSELDPADRRGSLRSQSATPAVLATVDHAERLLVTDISGTGARLQGKKLPSPGEALMVTIGRLRIFATARWRHGGLCGVQFELHTEDEELAERRRAVHRRILATIFFSAEHQQRAAAERKAGRQPDC